MAEQEDIPHRKMAAGCFNKAWDYIEKTDRTVEETEAMINVAHASCYHWGQVPNATDQNHSVGAWQLSRVYAVAGIADRAEYYAKRCVKISEDAELAPFFIAYGYEALARSLKIADDAGAADHIEKARALAQEVEDEADRKLLTDDLDALS